MVHFIEKSNGSIRDVAANRRGLFGPMESAKFPWNEGVSHRHFVTIDLVNL